MNCPVCQREMAGKCPNCQGTYCTHCGNGTYAIPHARRECLALTVERVRAAVEALIAAGGYEEGHMGRDELYIQVLREIATGAENAAGLAAEALRLEDAGLTLWYA